MLRDVLQATITTFEFYPRADPSTPAFEVSAGGDWHGDEYQMTVRGKTREATLYSAVG